MDLEDEVLPLPVSQQLVSVAPPSATNCSEVEPHQGLTLQVLQLGVSNAPPTDGSPVASTSMPPLSSKSGATAPLGKRSSKKSVQAASGDGPKKQKLQLEREELLRIEKNFVKKVPSSVGLAGYNVQLREVRKVVQDKTEVFGPCAQLWGAEHHKEKEKVAEKTCVQRMQSSGVHEGSVAEAQEDRAQQPDSAAQVHPLSEGFPLLSKLLQTCEAPFFFGHLRLPCCWSRVASAEPQ